MWSLIRSANSSVSLTVISKGVPNIATEPALLMPVVYSTEFAPGVKAAYSVVLTVHNRATTMHRTLPTLLRSVGGDWELAVVLDDCTDGSRSALMELLPRAAPACASAAASSNASSRGRRPAGFLLRHVVFAASTALFETASEGLGMRLLDPSLAYLLVQADVVFEEPGWKFVLASAMAADRRVVAVSGRCVQPRMRSHNLWCAGDARKQRAHISLDRQAAALRGIGPRGPLLLRASAARALGFLDESCFWLGGDDMDLQRRAFDHFGWLGAYVYIDIFQPKSMHQAQTKSAAHKGTKGPPPFDAWRADSLPTKAAVGCRHNSKIHHPTTLEHDWSKLSPDKTEPFSLNVSWLREAFATRAGSGCGGRVPEWVLRMAAVGVGRNNTYILKQLQWKH